MNIVLFGDSSIDNRLYVGADGKPVVEHLRGMLGDGHIITDCSLDGARLRDIRRQMSTYEYDNPDWIVISIGGNDALQFLYTECYGKLDMWSLVSMWGYLTHSWMGDYAEILARMRQRFEAAKIIICGIYYPGGVLQTLPRPSGFTMEHIIGADVWNGAISRLASEHMTHYIDLRTVMTVPDDYFNPIEPSNTGGLWIASRIAREIKGKT